VTEAIPATNGQSASATGGDAGPSGRGAAFADQLRRLGEANVFVVTVCALLAALVVGAILILVTTPTALTDGFGDLFSRPAHGLNVLWQTIASSYCAMLEGSIVDPHTLSHAISTGYGWDAVFTPLSETLVSATPLILAGTGVAIGFSTGVFNIGAQGQLIMGALAALWVGFAIHVPIGIHIPLVIIAGALGGAIAGFIPGILKARTGAHEVITTIMLNYVFLDLLSYLLTIAPFTKPGQRNSISKSLPATARMPHLFGNGLRVNLALVVALAAAAAVSWLSNHSRLGFSFRVIGLNPDAGRTAGMDPRRVTMLVLTISGALAGLAGMATLSGTDFFLSTGYGGNIGFDAITVALLGRNRPGGVVLGALLFAALDVGGRNMQASTGIPVDLTTVIQAIIVFFVATPALVREVFRLREARAQSTLISTKGWAG
jgi:simple sugar transport system permease protein